MRDDQGAFKSQLLVLTPPAVRNKCCLKCSQAGRKAPKCQLTSGLYERKVSASSVLRLQTHFLRQNTMPNFKMRSPPADRQFLSKQALCLCTNNFLKNSIDHNTAVWPGKCVNSCCNKLVDSQLTTEFRWKLEAS